MAENVSHFHYAHSFVRGNWHNREQSSPMILAKCCHDLDMMHWLVGSHPKYISSFGSQQHFGLHNLPAGATDSCHDCPAAIDCHYDTKKIYTPHSGWPTDVVTEDTSEKGLDIALRNGPYGRCVYRIEDHNIVDHQVFQVEFENKMTGSLTMHGFAPFEGRSIRIDGTKASLEGEFGYRVALSIMIPYQGKKKIQLKSADSGHGGGDFGLMREFLDFIADDKVSPRLSTVNQTVISHTMAFSAEKARIEGVVISLHDE
ncbi:MAG: hypothetical protein INQ03_11195 [Candidatus Heimdallarchaeota archaeon]|nr:hypothetical protein [Candidatus Heimdallarchaeota archaeon]